MSLHTDWAAAKKEAFKLFKEAQKNWLKKQDAKINVTKDPKARKKALDAVLDEAGLDKGESLDDYLKFADGFGKSLDELEKAVLKNQKAAATLTGATLDGILADKNLLRHFLAYCQRIGSTRDITYYMADYKKSPQATWDTYVNHGAPHQIDISEDHNLFDNWMAAGADAQLLAAQGKSLCDRLRVHVENDLKGEIVRKFKIDPNVKVQMGITDLTALKKDVRDTAEKYKGQIEQAVAKWKKLQPQFWTPLHESLEAIDQYVKAN